jgi:NCS2 family nucleobase:cation symporter-2
LTFYTKDEPLPLLLAAIMGLQHAFAMVGGLITPPLVIFKFSVNFTDVATQQYVVSAALICSGISSWINLSKTPIPFTKKLFKRQLYVGSGVLSVMGTSFTFLPIFETSISQMREQGIDGYAAYGAMLGTVMVCCLLETFLSLMPVRWIQKVFPPLVSSITVILIGIALTGSGMKYWGGGVVCADMIWKQHSQLDGVEGVPPNPGPICQNGDVFLGYGSTAFIGLGFSVMVMLVFIEIFGSTFMKNCNVILALLFGYMIAGVSNNDGNNYVDTDVIKTADWVTFLWTTTFPIGFYAPAVIPCLIAFGVTTVETVGDISATYEVSELDNTGHEFLESLQGGLLSDSLCTILSALGTSMPNTTFSQNNGVIALTKCAAKRAGYACGCWLVFLGVFAKFAGIITSIPDAVIGGMTIFLFANVLASGIALASSLDLHSRRIKFIMALSLAVGSGVTVFPYAFIDLRASQYTANFWRCADCSDALKGLRNGIAIFLSTGYCVGTVIAIMLNMILPEDAQVIKTSDARLTHDETADVTATIRDDGIDFPKDLSDDSAEEGTSEDLDKSAGVEKPSEVSTSLRSTDEVYA